MLETSAQIGRDTVNPTPYEEQPEVSDRTANIIVWGGFILFGISIVWAVLA